MFWVGCIELKPRTLQHKKRVYQVPFTVACAHANYNMLHVTGSNLLREDVVSRLRVE